MTLSSHAFLPDSTPVDVTHVWSFNSGTPGTLSDARGWELDEFWVPGRPRLTIEERKFVEEQLQPPDLP